MAFAHAGQPLEPHDVWSAWHAEPVVIAGLTAAAAALAWAYLASPFQARRARRPRTTRGRTGLASAAGALAVVAVALVSPLDAMSDALASAHMVQHVLLTLVGAPLLAVTPLATVVAVTPRPLRRRLAIAGRRIRHVSTVVRQPLVAWLLHAGTLWLWHASVLYDAALRSATMHALEHISFLATGVLFWRVVLGPARRAVSHGGALLLVFGMAMQSVLLSALLTFSREPWYAGYETTTEAWGIDHLADQQLAGVIMWVPAGFVYVAVALLLVVRWLRSGDGPRSSAVGR